MARLSLWQSGRKGNDFKLTDRIISEFFNVSGTALYLHIFLGVYEAGGGVAPITTIQDVLFQENRDRKYSKDVFEMRGTYNVQDNDFDLRQFGFFMSGDTLFIEVHLNDMLALIGRKIMPGDVIELPHLREIANLDGSEVTNRFYVVEESSRASAGYSATWWPHIWRVKIAAMTSAQEFADILDQNNKDPFGLDTGTPLRDILTTDAVNAGINDAVLVEAEKFNRNFETRQFYFIPGDEVEEQLPWLWSGDGIPPNGAVLLGSGNSFPDNPSEDDYYLRIDYQPAQLFRRVGSAWIIQEIDYRMSKWSAMTRHRDSAVNNTNTTTFQDGTTIPEKGSLSKAVRPPTDF